MRVDGGNFVPSVSPGHAHTVTVSQAKGRWVGIRPECRQFGFKTNFLKNHAKALSLNCARDFVILATPGHSV